VEGPTTWEMPVFPLEYCMLREISNPSVGGSNPSGRNHRQNPVLGFSGDDLMRKMAGLGNESAGPLVRFRLNIVPIMSFTLRSKRVLR
jgi:hypothetical protein